MLSRNNFLYIGDRNLLIDKSTQRSVASNKIVFGQVIEGYKAAVNAYRVRKNKKEALQVFGRTLKAQLSEN